MLGLGARSGLEKVLTFPSLRLSALPWQVHRFLEEEVYPLLKPYGGELAVRAELCL